MVVVSIASSAELKSLKKTVTIKEQHKNARGVFSRSIIHDKEIVLVKTGVGPKSAAAAAKHIIAVYEPCCIFSIGAAGAVDSSLQVGDIVVVQKIFQESGQALSCDHDLSQNVFQIIQESGLPVIRGNCLSIKRFIHQKAEKKRLAARFNVQVVDMESSALAHVICSAGINFIDVRIVSDTAAHDTVDMNSVVSCRLQSGAAGVCMYFLRHPFELIRAVTLKKNLYQVSSLIAQIVETVVCRSALSEIR